MPRTAGCGLVLVVVSSSKDQEGGEFDLSWSPGPLQKSVDGNLYSVTLPETSVSKNCIHLPLKTNHVLVLVY